MSNSTQYLEQLNFENLDIFDSKGNYIKLSDLLENYHRQAKSQELNENNIKGLRDEFAMAALNGLHNMGYPEEVIDAAYRISDMMIERRKK